MHTYRCELCGLQSEPLRTRAAALEEGRWHRARAHGGMAAIGGRESVQFDGSRPNPRGLLLIGAVVVAAWVVQQIVHLF